MAPADEQPLDTTSWRIAPPEASSRSGVVVTFPKPLDHGLLMRALGVTRDGQPVDGDVVVDQQETRWTFTPKDAWRAGTYELLALDILEDPAGNQIGPRVRGGQLRHRRQESRSGNHHDPLHGQLGRESSSASSAHAVVEIRCA